MKRHLTLRSAPRIHRRPDLGLLHETLAPTVVEALRAASQHLTTIGVRHALVGSLAVGAYGWPHVSARVKYLVGAEAFVHHEEGLVTTAVGLPSRVGAIVVDCVRIAPDERHLDAAVANPVMSGGVPIAPLEALFYLKLKSPRRKDAVDLVELVKAGVATAPVRRYLEANAPGLTEKFDALVAEAINEEE